MARVAGVDLTHAYNVPALVQKTEDPTENDDENIGFSIGDLWFNTDSGQFFICGSALSGKAAWASFASVPIASQQQPEVATGPGSPTMTQPAEGSEPRVTVDGPATSV